MSTSSTSSSLSSSLSSSSSSSTSEPDEHVNSSNNNNNNKKRTTLVPKTMTAITSPSPKNLELRKFSKIPIFCVENHNEILAFIYRCFGARYLPLKNNKLIHFDSHPDMVIPKNISIETLYDSEKLLNELSIENWIIPMISANHLTDVLWIKPWWSKQIENDGKYNFLLGHDDNGFIKCNSTLDYFFSDGNYLPEHKLLNSKLVDFYVYTLKTMADNNVAATDSRDDNSSTSHNLDLFKDLNNVSSTHKNNINSVDRNNLYEFFSNTTTQQTVASDDGANAMTPTTPTSSSSSSSSSNCPSYILDIDLDFFSTHNPFLKIYEKANVYGKLKKIFTYKTVENLNSDKEIIHLTKLRLKQLNQLEKLFIHLQIYKNLNNFNLKLHTAIVGQWPLILELFNDINKHYDINDINWQSIYDAGCTCDLNDDLPHHHSTDDEIDRLLHKFKQFLIELLPIEPKIITISRSSEDDYCPVEQVDGIETKVLNALKDVYGDKLMDKPILDYKNDSWNVYDI